MPLAPDSILKERYRISALLGQGGFGAVYSGFDLNLSRKVAIKENFHTTPEAARQFEREATLLASLRHSNLPTVFDHFIIPGQGQYLVMEFIEGDDLQQMISARGALPESDALRWIDQVAAALDYLHRQTPPIIHRDVKPGNIKITPAGEAILVDFGIAKQYSAQQRTVTAAQAVTPGYSPPEQYGEAVTDARSDVYALGATLNALLTGSPPVNSLDRLIGKGSLTPPQSIIPNISSSTSVAVLKALELRPEDRFSTMAEFRYALKRQAAPATQALPAETETRGAVTWRPPAAPPRRTNWLLIGAVVVGIPMLIVIAGIVLALTGVVTIPIVSSPTATPTATPAPSATPVPPTDTATPAPTVVVVTATPAPATDTPLPAAPTDTPSPAFTPTATRFAGGEGKITFWSHESGLDRIFVMNPDGSGLGEIARGVWPAWAPDGRVLAFIRNQLQPPDESLYVKDPRKQEPDFITRVPVEDNHLAWSPDGQYILFSDFSKGGGEGRALTLINPTTKEKKVVLDDGALNLDGTFSPDGSKIAFSSNKTGDFEIYVTKADGSEAPQQVVFDAGFQDRYPSWTPDGQKIAFSSNREDGIDQIYVMRADGNDVVRITHGLIADRQPVWSPDGQHIAFASFRDGNLQIYLMEPDGSNQKRLTTRFNFPNQNPVWQPPVK
ncbi:MAG: PD40 domain-containing protein [Chloroflexi bacterium]|nr:PD40 domain-containing protein [Chloroflexota bacterium]